MMLSSMCLQNYRQVCRRVVRVAAVGLLLLPCVFGASYYDILSQAERTIDTKYPQGNIANQAAKQDLLEIHKSNATEEEKIRLIQEKFLRGVKPGTKELTPENASMELLATLRLLWHAHSIAIAYNVDSQEKIILNESIVQGLSTSSSEANSHEMTETETEQWERGASGEGKAHASAGVLPFQFSLRADLDSRLAGAYKKVQSWNSAELWSRKSQMSLSKGYKQMAERVREARVSGCYLSFVLTFENLGDQDLYFDPQTVTIPIYAGNTHMLDAMPVARKGVTRYELPRHSMKDITFRGSIDNTKALHLVEFMRHDEPEVRVTNGQFRIVSDDGTVIDAIQDSTVLQTIPIFCERPSGGMLRWQILTTYGDRAVTLEQALWAINGIYEKPPFVFSNGSCISILGCGLTGDVSKLRFIPGMYSNGTGQVHFGMPSRQMLESRLEENGITFRFTDLGAVKSVNEVLTEDNAVEFQKCLVDWANRGHAAAQNRLGWMYVKGFGVTMDYTEAVKWYRKAAEQGYATAQYNLGLSYAKGRGVMKDYAEALKWFQKGAEHGNASAQLKLFKMYKVGLGVEVDNAKAVKWCHKAAEQGNAEAQYNLGECYAKGKGVTYDYTVAVKWYRKAAEQGFASAQFMLGLMYANGHGVIQDEAKAVEWYRKAAEQGDAMAQNSLGVYYEKGKGVEQNRTEAVKWYRKAAEQGHAMAQFNLGLCYDFGKGVEQNRTEAVKWYRKAADQQYKPAKIRLEKLGL